MSTLGRLIALTIGAPFVLAALLLDVPFVFAAITVATWRGVPSADATQSVTRAGSIPFAKPPTHCGSEARH